MRDVEAANAALYNAFESGDVDLMEAVWDTSDDIVCVHPGWPMLRGRQEVMRSWSALMANTDYIQFVLTDVRIAVNGDAAVVTCTENILTSADVGDSGSAVATNVFLRRPDGWRLVVHHGSPVLGRVEHE